MSLPTRIALAVAGLVVLCGAWLLFAPPLLGGKTTYVVTHGISMQPRFHTGDLVLLRARPRYAVGQIVAYHSDDLNRTVMHRIIAFDGARYDFKGDNNNFVDPTHPTENELIGSYWFSIPKVGLALVWASEPAHAPLVVGLAILLAFSGSLRRKTRRTSSRPRGANGAPLLPAPWVEAAERRAAVERPAAAVRQQPPPFLRRPVQEAPAPAPAPAAEPDAPAPPAIELPPLSRERRPAHAHPHAKKAEEKRGFPFGPPMPAAVVAVVAAAVAALAAFVLLAALGQAATTRTTLSNAYSVESSFGYAAKVPASTVYPSGRVHTGAPVFVKLVHSVAVSFSYRFASFYPHGVHGTGRLKATVTSPQGWSRTVTTAGPQKVVGDTGTITATLDLRDVEAVVRRFESLTGVQQSTYTIGLQPVLDLEGYVAGAPVTATVNPPLNFSLDSLQLTVQAPQTLGNGPAPDPLKSTQTGSVDKDVPALMSLGVATLTVGAARHDALVLLALAGGAAAAAGRKWLAARRASRPDEDERIERELADWIVPIASGLHPSSNVVDVESIDSLVQIADHYERMILRERGRDGFVYLVEEGGTVYRYAPRVPALPAEAKNPQKGEHTLTAAVEHPGDASTNAALGDVRGERRATAS